MLPPATPDLFALQLLDSVAELGSLGQAAIRHGVSQAAVSMRKSQLERRLGVSLLQRGPARDQAHPRRAADHRARPPGARGGRGHDGRRCGRRGGGGLRVAASLTVAEHLLPGWISALHGESPDVVLAVEVTNSSKVLARIGSGGAEVGFVENHDAPPAGLAAVVVRSDRLVVVVHPAHRWARRAAPVTGPELAGADLIVREPGSGTREVLDDALRAWGGPCSRLELGPPAPSWRRPGGVRGPSCSARWLSPTISPPVAWSLWRRKAST